MKNNKNTTFCWVLITLCFLVTASGYLSWLYHLMDFTDSQTADLLSEVVGYLFQALGFLSFGILVKKRKDILLDKRIFIAALVSDYVLMCLSVLTGNLAMILVFGYGMNFLHGIIGGYYLSYLTMLVEKQRRALVFGISYGGSNLGTWLLSLPCGGRFLALPYALMIYGMIFVLLLYIVIRNTAITNPPTSETKKEVSPGTKILVMAGVTVLFLSLVKNIGFYFPSADISAGISLEFSRMFYALGLVMAGIISDRDRRWGGIACVVSLIFPFMLMNLSGRLGISVACWILGYLFFGFFTVYRVILFTDFAEQDEHFMYLAGFGMLFGRIGDALGAFFGMHYEDHYVVFTIASAMLFAVTVALFFGLYQGYYAVAPDRQERLSTEDCMKQFLVAHEISRREREILTLVGEGKSNSEIAASLFISENTVKFHVKNLLKKTECKNRVELTDLIESMK